MPEERLLAFQQELAQSSPLLQMFLSGSRWRRLGKQAQALRDIFMCVAPGLSAPIDLLAQSRGGHPTDFIRPRLWSGELPAGAVIHISDDVGVASPAFALQQVLARSSWAEGYLMASELCGSFAVHAASKPTASLLGSILDQSGGLRALSAQGGWRPCAVDGAITDLWSRPALVEPHELSAFAEASPSARGKARLLEVAGLIKPGAASPLEVQAGALLGLPPQRGGMGLDGFEFNKRIALSPEASLICQKSTCYCDLYYEDGQLDIECQSAMIHDNEESLISDFERSAALGSMGIDVLFASSSILASPRRFRAFASLAADKLGEALPRETEARAQAQTNLRSALFADWRTLI